RGLGAPPLILGHQPLRRLDILASAEPDPPRGDSPSTRRRLVIRDPVLIEQLADLLRLVVRNPAQIDQQLSHERMIARRRAACGSARPSTANATAPRRSCH